MKPKTDQAPITAWNRIDSQLICGHRHSLEALLDFVAPDEPVSIQNIRFDEESIFMILRWPFRWPPLSGSGDYLGTVKARAQFLAGLQERLSGGALGKQLSNALFKELKAFAIFLTGGYRGGKRAFDALNSLGERRMAGRPSSNKIEKREADQILRHAEMIQLGVAEISKRAKSSKSKGPALRKKILEDYDRDQYPWIRSLFPALENLHGKPTLDKLDRPMIRKLVTAIIQSERRRETGTKHSLDAINKVIRSI